ncbi:MAG: hypothetical protein QY314_02300 [Candidatus Dojkabacteria bacterium]|nr:MAG: hypothetical protein QY314_02300 [Candidatus Dojkabacteria bacterium]
MMGSILTRAFGYTVDVIGTVGPTAGFLSPSGGDAAVRGLFTAAISLIIVVGVGMIIYGGYKFIMSRGDPRELQSAQQLIINAIIGLIVVLAAFAIAGFILGVFDVDLPGTLPTT